MLLAGYPEWIYISSERISIILGLLTLSLALATVFSCRSMVSWLNRLGWKKLSNNRTYQSFYRHHSAYWYGFWTIFAFHLVMGLMHAFMNPEIPDPDKYLHWYSIWSGLGGIFLVGSVFFSCRLLPGPLTIFFNKNPLSSSSYRRLYRYHSYYWLVFFVIIATHYVFGFIHSGIWPY